MLSKNSAHAFTNPRERIPDITATGVNVPIETFQTTTVADAVDAVDARRTDGATSIAATTTKQAPKLSETLPPLIFGTATFNYQFNPDPYALHPNQIVAAALRSGIRAFDTSPYYGPAEEILGNALHSGLVTSDPALRNLRREDYFLLTKCGRIRGDEFDYSPGWIRHSVQRSLRRLKTTYLDAVYLHDIEFVSAPEVLTGVRALRQLRDEIGSVRYVGICGYPVGLLCDLAEMVLRETGEAVDIVQSYANYTIQNERLVTDGLHRLVNAGVDVVPNASPLGMGLCRSQGVPVGNSSGAWHPAPDGLRTACLQAANYIQNQYHEKLESIAIRFAMENWLTEGAAVGSCGATPSEGVVRLAREARVRAAREGGEARPRLGVTVVGVSKVSELEDTMAVYNNIVAAQSDPSKSRRHQIWEVTRHIRENILGKEWTDYAWESPGHGFVNTRQKFGVSAAEKEEFERECGADDGVKIQAKKFGTEDAMISPEKSFRVYVREIAAADD